MDHPTRDDLRRFVLAALPETADLAVERHLEGAGDEPGCEACLYEARALTPAADLAQEEGVTAFADALYRDDADDDDATRAATRSQRCSPARCAAASWSTARWRSLPC